MKNNITRTFDKSRVSLITAAVFLSAGMVAPAYAQEADEGFVIEELIVTARNREESLQDIPLAITAFSKEDLERKSISDLDDVARFTSGFSFEDFSGGFATPVIRGQAQTRVTALEQNVAVFFDGLYVPRSWAVDVGTSNIDRIEIVKGPQSARYGRNAFSGAINYIPGKASLDAEEFSGNVEITLGSDEREDIGASIEAPLSDKFVIAASYNTSEFDGSWENDHPFANLDIGDDRSTNGNAGGWDNTAFSASLAAQLTDKWVFDLAFYNYEQKNEQRAGQQFDNGFGTGVFNCGNAVLGRSLLVCGELPEATDTATIDPRGYGVHSDTDVIRLSTTFDLSDAWSINYLYGSVDGDVETGTNTEPDKVNCGSILPAFVFGVKCNFGTTPIGSIDYETHELRLNFEGDSLRGAFGLFSSDGEDAFQFNSINIAPITDPNNFTQLVGQSIPSGGFFQTTVPFNIRATNDLTQTDVTSIFGEIGWTSSDGRTRLGAEVRYSETDLTLLQIDGNLTFEEEFKVVTPRFTYERDLNDNRLVYATIARGAKTGGFNSGAISPANQSFDEELNWTYEAGLKNTFMDGRWTLNASVFYTDWTDIQINSADPDSDNPISTSITSNLGDADVFGIELDTVFWASENLTFDATFSFADGSYKSGTIDQRFARSTGRGGPSSCDNIVCSASGNIGGNEIERAPRTQASLGAQWEADISSGSYFIRGDVSWQSEFYASPVNLATIPSRTLLNLRAGMSFNNGLSIDAWIKNLADEEYLSNSFVVITPFNNQYGEFFGERRTLGVTAKYDF